jgi:hypothetical protein
MEMTMTTVLVPDPPRCCGTAPAMKSTSSQVGRGGGRFKKRLHAGDE